MNARAELLDLVRQIRAELTWATRTGLVAAPPEPRAEQLSAPPRVDEMLSTPPLSVEGTASDRPQPVIAFAPGDLEPAKVVPLSLEAIREELGDCTRCKLSRLGRKQIVFGVGNPKAELMFVGEGPGYNEDLQGEPFVGDAGQLLTKIIEAMGFARRDVYIANVVKCRPPNNRDPEPDEVASCEPFLQQQIASVGPKVLVALGRHAAQTLLKTSTPISRLRGKWGTYQGIPLMPTYHPAYLLRNPAEKRPLWEDMKVVVAKLGRELPARGKS